MSDKKADIIRCNLCTADNSNDARIDKTKLTTDESWKKYQKIISCGECFKDEDEDSCYYHPDCYEIKHNAPYMSDKKIQKHRAITREITFDKAKSFMKLSSAQKRDFVMTSDSLVHAIGGAVESAVPHLATLMMATSSTAARAASGVAVNLVDEIATVAATAPGGVGGAIGIGALANGAFLLCEIGDLAYKRWITGEIDSKAFKVGAIESVVGNLGSAVCSSIGAWLGSLGGPIGTIIGGVIGAILGGFVNHYARKRVGKYYFDLEEDTARAEIVIEAFYFLNLPLPHMIDESVVGSHFRKAALQCHPDTAKVQAMTSKDEKAKAKFQWELLRHARDVALGYVKEEESFSARCHEMIKKKYDPAKKAHITFDQLKASLGSHREGGSLTYT